MMVTKLEPYNHGRIKVYIEEEFAFLLYKKELKRFHVEVEHELSEETCIQIHHNLSLRCKKLALHLLERMDRSERELRTKLRDKLYPSSIIDEAIVYVKSFGYINDSNYGRKVIERCSTTKSRIDLKHTLQNKGLDRDLVEELMEKHHGVEDTQIAIQNLLRKRKFDASKASREDYRRIYAYLARRGFSYDDVNAVLRYDESSY